MDECITYVGLDVHKEAISVALAEGSRRGKVREHGQISSTPAALTRLSGKLSQAGSVLRFCYEVDPCGCGIQRQLTAAGHDCAMVAPSLQSLRGMALVTAATVIAELSDITRFANPRQLMAYLGLVPSGHSSGASRRQGGVAKAGNGAARRMLIEAAWSYRVPARISRE